MKLPVDFYLDDDVVALSKALLGKLLVTRIDGQVTSGLISETEAYAGITDKASHAFGDRRTARTETMYRKGGCAYIYLCYGIHHLFNVVTAGKDTPHAVLIRGIQPVHGLPVMLERRKRSRADKNLSAGPGTLTQALGIHTALDGTALSGHTIWIEDTGQTIPEKHIMAGPRIGIDYAGEDAKRPYRFLLAP